ncbi:hypothetical protein NPIL_275101 [Nephila pilipes]|uniref:Uncharacterized protein n=1 Tax=Nephila pilipes TaxID=299642 RepID=A0A8X6NM50_NEPPI|nr:hypothetical protein NPIL_275101 [Nephila pilipes]
MMVRELTEEANISNGSVNYILIEDFSFRKILIKFMAKLLMIGQRQLRLKIPQDLLETVNSYSNNYHTVILDLLIQPRNQVAVLRIEASRISE